MRPDFREAIELFSNNLLVGFLLGAVVMALLLMAIMRIDPTELGDTDCEKAAERLCAADRDARLDFFVSDDVPSDLLENFYSPDKARKAIEEAYEKCVDETVLRCAQGRE